MKVFVTGATGFIGNYLVPELIMAGHQVIGLTRSDEGEEELSRARAQIVRGDINDLALLHDTAAKADGVIHTAFNHDFSKLKESSENDRKVIAALGEALAGTDKPLIITSGTGLVRSKTGGPTVESDGHATSAGYARAASEEAADELIKNGQHVIIVRLPQVHDIYKQGRIAEHIKLGKEKGFVAYVGKGENRLPAVHVADAACLFRLALERGKPGGRYHAVAEEGIPMREIAKVIGEGLNLPVKSISDDQVKDYYGWLAGLAPIDLSSSGEQTQKELDWKPAGPGLLTDLSNMDYKAI